MLEFLSASQEVGEKIPVSTASHMYGSRAIIYKLRGKSVSFVKHLEHAGFVRFYEERVIGAVGRPKRFIEPV